MIELGKIVVDRITGFSGTTTGKTEWLYGCVRFGVQSKELKDGKPVELQWFDEQQLVPLDDKTPDDLNQLVKEIEGGPQKDPRRADDPSRI